MRIVLDSFLSAAIKVLKDAKEPLPTKEIVSRAIENRYIKTSGKTPEKTMNARLSVHVMEKGYESLIMRTETGVFALREWKSNYPEYVAQRRTISPIEEDILVFKKGSLGNFINQDGFNYSSIDTLKEMVDSSYSIKRLDAEEDFTCIQLVSSFLITYENEILTYKRSKRLPENRLHDAYSLNFGGHITYEDKLPLFGLEQKSFINMFIRRELDEEVRFISPPKKLLFKGFIYDSSTDLGKQHIGIVFHVPVSNKHYKIGERGFLLQDEFVDKEIIKSNYSKYDSWSQLIAADFIKGLWNDV